jgi:ATP-dependent DNA helicase RecG
MASALETLIKVLKQESKSAYPNLPEEGGFLRYGNRWAAEARQQARRPEQLALIEELLLAMADYEAAPGPERRAELAEYMQGRITRRAEAVPQYAVPVEHLQVKLPPPAKVAKPEVREPREQREDSPPRGQGHRRAAPAGPEQKPKPRRGRRPQISSAEALALWAAAEQPITKVRGVGEKMAEKLARLGLHTLRDMLFFFPRRYDDYTQMVPLHKVQPNQNYTLLGTIIDIRQRVGQGKIDLLSLTISDGTAKLQVSFFNQMWLRRQLKMGMQLVFSGKTDLYLGKVVLNNPLWEPVEQQNLRTGGIIPVYPLTMGLSSHTMRKLMGGLVQDWADKLPDPLPNSVLERCEQVSFNWALRQIHQPERPEYIGYARERLAFDELLVFQLGVMARRTEWQAQIAPALTVPDDWLAEFISGLPFPLTGAQAREIEAMRADIAQNLPMNRLLQGDVGSGKTVVAAALMGIAAMNDYQAALMAPTNILAEQHYHNISQLFAGAPGLQHKRVALLTGSLTEKARRQVYEDLESGDIDLLIGTQALIQAELNFPRLALAIIDEQHRFGVEQRGALRGKGMNPHLLVMSATPIPRTLSLTMYADLDLSLLDEMPPGRLPPQTRIVTEATRIRAYEFLEDKVLARGHQLYIIYPMIEESERNDWAAATAGYETIQKHIYPRYRAGLLHGRMKPAEKEAVMEAFARHELDILVSTTVIEVGVDVPNATAIIIENAERFGLAQLHQLRGRVGRGGGKAYCLLLSDKASSRLEALEQSHDGFYLAEQDWKERGAGDLLGLRQSGGGDSRLNAVLAEQMTVSLVQLAQTESRALYAEDPELSFSEHALLAQRVQQGRDQRSDLS